MSPRIGVCDYGVGNLRSVERALLHAGAMVTISADAADIADCDGAVLPGVGAFTGAVKTLRENGLAGAVTGLAAAGKPVLGVCLGFQLLFEHSDEGDGASGLGLLPGAVTRLRGDVKVPHMGWNRLRLVAPAPLLDAVEDGAYMYFVHSYTAAAEASAGAVEAPEAEVITGLHGLHVLVGLLISLVVQIKAWQGKFAPDRHTSVQVFSLYWLFVDVVWIVVFSSLTPHMTGPNVTDATRKAYILQYAHAGSEVLRGDPQAESAAAVERVVRACVRRGCAVQIGGGVRSVDAARHWLDMGADGVIIGSVAARSWELARQICEASEGRVLLSLDVHAGRARIQGWTQDGAAMTELLRVWHDWPTLGLVYTDTTRDGMLLGPNLAGLATCVETYAGPVFLSGGVSSVDDIVACQAGGAAGVVVGSALYERRIDLADALSAFPVTA